MRPGAADITTMRSARISASSMEWVMNSGGLAAGGVDAQQLPLHDLARHRIERGERFVHQQHFGIGGQDARQGDALLHAAGQLRRIAVLEPAELHQVDEALRRRPVAPRGRRPCILRPNSTLPRTVFQGNSA